MRAPVKMRLVMAGWLGLIFLGLGGCAEKDEEGAGSAGSAGRDEEGAAPAYVLARPNSLPPVGSKVAVSGLFEFLDAPFLVREGSGPAVVGSRSATTRKSMHYEVVSPHQVKVRVESDVENVTTITRGAPTVSPPAVSPIQGKPLTFDLTDGAWVGTLDEGGELSDEEMEKVARIAEKLSGTEPLGVYGTAPRKIGEEWDIDAKRIPILGADSDFLGSFRMSFDRVEEFEGEECAVLTGVIDVKGTRDQDTDFELTMTATMTTYRSLKHLEDMKRTVEGRMAISGLGGGVRTTVRGPFTMTHEAKLFLPGAEKAEKSAD